MTIPFWPVAIGLVVSIIVTATALAVLLFVITKRSKPHD